MGKRSVIVLAILVVACAVGITWLALREREPVYKGKPLSEWLHGYDFKMSSDPPDVRGADEAVKAVGTNVIPTLLRLLDQRESRLDRLWTYLRASIGLITQSKNQAKNSLKNNIVVEMPDAFHALGSNGASAVPRLLEIYRSNPSPNVKLLAIASIQQIGPAAQAATPVLIKIATQPDTNGFMVRYQAVYALANIADGEVSVPALIKCLGDGDGAVRDAAATSLSFLGTNARPAVPALIKLVKESDNIPQVKMSAQIALGKIDPAAATNAGVSVLLLVDPK